MAKQEGNEETLTNGIVTLKVDAGKRSITVKRTAIVARVIDAFVGLFEQTDAPRVVLHTEPAGPHANGRVAERLVVDGFQQDIEERVVPLLRLGVITEHPPPRALQVQRKDILPLMPLRQTSMLSLLVG